MTPDLWSFAVLYAVNIWNHSPSQTRKCPLSASSTYSSPSLDHFHPFGCPVYILNRSLADGNSIPRWHPRSHLGIYLGRSPNHAKDVSLVLDLNTNYIFAKYHIIYDNKFETITNSNNNNNIWTTLFIEQLQSTYNQYLPPPSTVDLQQHPSSPTKPIHPTKNVRNAPPNSSTLRSGRVSHPPRRLAYLHEHNPSSLTSFEQYISILQDKLSAINSPAIHTLTKYSNLQAHTSPISFNNDSPTSKEALISQYSSDFLLAEQAELDKLHQLNTWSIVTRNEIKNKSAILHSTWVDKTASIRSYQQI